MFKNKKVWTALAAVAIALGTLFTALGDANAWTLLSGPSSTEDCQYFSVYHQSQSGVAGAKWGKVYQYFGGYPGGGWDQAGVDLAIQASKDFGTVEIWFLSRNAEDTDYTYYPSSGPFYTGTFNTGTLKESTITGVVNVANILWDFDKWTIVVDPIVNGTLDQYATGAVEFNWFPKNSTWMNANTTNSTYWTTID